MKRKTIFFLWLVAVAIFPLCGQQRRLQNRPYADDRLFHFGFSLGIHTQDLILTQSGYVNENGAVWFCEIPDYSPGFTAGIIGDLHLNRYLNLRLIPSIYLGDKRLVFREQTSAETYEMRIRNNYLSVPLQLKIASPRIDNFRPYFLMGGYGNIEIAPIKGKAIRLKPYDVGIELGVGCHFYLPLFTLSPELIFRFGMGDMLVREQDDLKDENLRKYRYSLSKATQRMITLSFNFE